MPTVEIDYPASGSTNVPRQFVASGTFAADSPSYLIQCTLRNNTGETVAISLATTQVTKGDSGIWTAPFSVDQDYDGASLMAVLTNPPSDNASHQSTDLSIRADPTLIVTRPLPRGRKSTDEKDQKQDDGDIKSWSAKKPLKVSGRVCAGVGVLVTLYLYRRDEKSADGFFVRIGSASTTMADAAGRWEVTFDWTLPGEQEILKAYQAGDKLAIIAAAIGRNGKHLGRVVWRLH